MTNDSLREMTLEDYDAIYALWTETPGMGLRSLDDSREGIERFLRRNPGLSYIAEENGRMLGVILCGHDGRRGYIYHTMVRPEARGRGIGRALVERAEAALRREGIHKAALVVFAVNDLGNDFWEAIGYTQRDDLTYRNRSLNDANI